MPKPRRLPFNRALTGHLVLTTVHANNVFDVIGRFASMGIDAYNFLAALTCVLAQRLIRMMCRLSTTRSVSNKVLAEESGLDYEQYKDAPCFLKAKDAPNAMRRGIAAEVHYGISGPDG